MDFTRGHPVREKCLRLGRKLGWFNVVLADKIKALQKEIRLTEANGISKSSKVDLSLTGKREEFPVDVNKAATSYDNVDCSDDIYVDDIGSDDDGDNGGKIHDSVIILDDDDDDDDVSSNDNSNNGINNNYNNVVDDDANTDNDESFDNSVAEVSIVIKCDDDNVDDFVSNDKSNNCVNSYNNGVDDDANTDDNDKSFDDSAAEIRSNFSNDDNGVDHDGNIDDKDDVIDKIDNADGNGSVCSSHGDNSDDGVDIDADDKAVITGDVVDGTIFNENGDDDNSINDDSEGVVSQGSDDENIDIDKVDITDEADDHDSHIEGDILDDSDDTSDTHFSCDGDGDVDVNENDDAVVNNYDSEISNNDEGDGCGIHEFDDDDVDTPGDIVANYGVNYNATHGIDDHDDEDAGIEGGGIINDSKNDATDEDGKKRDNEQDIYDNVGGSIHDCSSYVDDNDRHDGGDSRRNLTDVCETDVIADSLEMIGEIPTAFCEMQLDILNDAVAARVSGDEGETHESESYPVDDGKIAHSMDRHREEACDVEARNNLSNGEKTDDTCSTEITCGVPLFVGSYYPSHVENLDIENDCQDGHIHTTDTFQGDINSKVDRDDDDDRDMKYNGIEDESDVVKLADSSDLEMDDKSDLVVMSRPTSSITDYSNNDDDCISDSPVKPSLSARLFQKYNPEKSESDADDFELFLQKVRTPKKLLSLSGEERQTETKSLEEFIVDDDDEELEEDVFVDPGFTPEEYDSDLENEGCYELATPVVSYTSFKTPLTNFPSRTPKSIQSKCYTAPSLRPKGVLDDVLASYAREKDFKKNREPLSKDLFKLYNRTVFENQLPSDFQITWNKRMRTTAGFCYYSRKNGVRMSRIELADKVIDSADRLRDTLIHEMCHAASWIISGVKAGHGPVWKSWAMRSNFVHQDLPPISRCHSYSINTKYTYRCTKCQNTFGRHSKSVNLEKSRCAHCKSRIELVPQLKKDGTPQTRTPSRFALFVKENFARIKSDNEHVSHQEIMKALSSEFAKLNT